MKNVFLLEEKGSQIKGAAFLLALCFAVLSYWLIDLIPVNQGQGFDGTVYHSMIVDWSQGRLGRAAWPYRFLRVGAFIPQIFICSLVDLSTPALLILSKLLAIAYGTLAGWFTFLAAYRIGEKEGRWDTVTAFLFFACYLASHAVFFMPSNYPLLTDHMALLIAGFSIWLWSREEGIGKNGGLALMIAYSFIVMPLLTLIPLTLFVFPYTLEHVPPPHKKNEKLLFCVWALSFFCAVYFIYQSFQIPDENFLLRNNASSPGLVSLKSYAAVITVLILSSALCVGILTSLHSFARISWRRVGLALLALVPSLIGLWLVPSWEYGMLGPDLLTQFKTQSLYAPGITLAGLVAHFGPIGLLGLMGLFYAVIRDKARQMNGLWLVTAFFLLCVSLISETRQFNCMLPLLVFICIALFHHDRAIALGSLLFSLGMFFIGWDYNENISTAVTLGHDLLAPTWQAYFGRTGPWMSSESVLLFLAVGLIYVMALCLLWLCKPHQD